MNNVKDSLEALRREAREQLYLASACEVYPIKENISR